jgi:hypothetical protein
MYSISNVNCLPLGMFASVDLSGARTHSRTVVVPPPVPWLGLKVAGIVRAARTQVEAVLDLVVVRQFDEAAVVVVAAEELAVTLAHKVQGVNFSFCRK